MTKAAWHDDACESHCKPFRGIVAGLLHFRWLETVHHTPVWN